MAKTKNMKQAPEGSKKEQAKKGMMSLGDLGFVAADKLAKVSGLEEGGNDGKED